MDCYTIIYLLSIITNIKLLEQNKGRFVKTSFRKINSKVCVSVFVCVCLYMYVLTVLTFKIFLDDYNRSKIFSTSKQNFT